MSYKQPGDGSSKTHVLEEFEADASEMDDESEFISSHTINNLL